MEQFTLVAHFVFMIAIIVKTPTDYGKKAESAPCGGKTAFETLNCGFILCIGGFSD